MGDRIAAWAAAARAALERVRWLPPLATRLAVGLVFVGAGWGKLHHLERVTAFFESLGLPHPGLQAPLVGTTELLCGSLLVLGLATRLAAVPLVVVMLVAIRTALWDQVEGVASLFGLAEALYVLLLLWVGIAGPGAVSLDALLARRAAAAPSRAAAGRAGAGA